MTPAELWAWMPKGYFFTILIETPVLWFGLSARHSAARRIFAGIWLTACSYPFVVIVFPILFEGRPEWQYISVAEIFAALSECLLFALAFRDNRRWNDRTLIRDMAAVAAANVISFLSGEFIFH